MRLTPSVAVQVLCVQGSACGSDGNCVNRKNVNGAECLHALTRVKRLQTPWHQNKQQRGHRVVYRFTRKRIVFSETLSQNKKADSWRKFQLNIKPERDNYFSIKIREKEKCARVIIPVKRGETRSYLIL